MSCRASVRGRLRGMVTCSAVLFAATAAVTAAPARADEPADSLAACVAPAIDAAVAAGARPSGDPWIGFMREGESRSLSVRLPTAGCYGFLGVGHRRVRDLDLYVHTEGGMQLTRDVAIDARPYVRYCGAEGLRLYVTARMVAGQGEFRVVTLADGPPSISDVERLLAGCAAGGGSIGEAGGVGPDPPQSTGQLSIDALTQRLAPLGYRRSGALVQAQVQAMNRDRRTVHLDGGRCYAVAAVGGTTAVDVDLALFSGEGRPLSQDNDRDRDAIVKLCPNVSVDVLAEVRIYRGGGDYGLQTFALDEPPPQSRPLGVEGAARIGYAEVSALLSHRGMDVQPLAWGNVVPGETLGMPVTLTGGECYAIAGVASGDLAGGDLDLTVQDVDGRLVAWDLGAGSTPIAYVCPDATAVVRAVGRVYGAAGRYLVLVARARAPAGAGGSR